LSPRTIEWSDFSTVATMKDNLEALKHVVVNSSAFTTAFDQKPFYYADRADLLSPFPDKYLSIFVPVAVYWICAIPFDFLDWLSPACLEKYRIHDSAEVQAKNKVSKSAVIGTVLFQQVLQVLLGYWWLEDDGNAKLNHPRSIQSILYFLTQLVSQILGSESTHHFANATGPLFASWLYWWGIPSLQILWAMFVLDTWQYCLHRLFHTRYLYRTIHSWHHRLYVPFAYGALYNHPIEGFLLDLLGSVVAMEAARMTVRQSIALFAIATAKTINDHSGWSLPLDPLQFMFKNNADYHDIHHQAIGIKHNFSQPFFVHWDRLLGTELTRDELEKKRQANRAKAKAS